MSCNRRFASNPSSMESLCLQNSAPKHHPNLKPLKKRAPSAPTVVENHIENHIDHMEQKPRMTKHQRVRRQTHDPDRCLRFLKGALHCYNVFILIIGSLVLGVGVWLLVKEYNSREIAALVGSRMVEFATYGLIAGGAAATILAFCGCCGTMRQDKFVLAFYAGVLVVVMCTMAAGCVLSIMFKDKVKFTLEHHFRNTIVHSYRVDINRNTTNMLVTKAWDSMQQALGCCGVRYDDRATVHYPWAIYKLHSDWYTNMKEKIPYVPESCCVPGRSKRKCQGEEAIQGPPSKGPPFGSFNQPNDALYTEGCVDKAISYLQTHSFILIIITATVPVLLIIGIAIAIYLAWKVKDVTDEDEVDV